MSFIPTNPAANETIGTFTVDINGFAVKGLVLYEAAVGGQPATIYIELEGNSDMAAAAAKALGIDISKVSIAGYSRNDVCGLEIMDEAGR